MVISNFQNVIVNNNRPEPQIRALNLFKKKAQNIIFNGIRTPLRLAPLQS